MKTITIKAEVTMPRSEPEEVEVIMTVDTDRLINKGNCGAIIKTLYPNHSVNNVTFSILPE